MVVSVAEFKDYLKIQYDEEDAVVERLLVQAQAAAEDFCRVTFDEEAPLPVKLAIQLTTTSQGGSRSNGHGF